MAWSEELYRNAPQLSSNLVGYGFTGIIRGNDWLIFKGEPKMPIKSAIVEGPVKISLGTDGKVEIVEAPLYTTFLKEFILAYSHGEYISLSADTITFSQTEGTSVTYRLCGYNVDTQLFAGERISGI